MKVFYYLCFYIYCISFFLNSNLLFADLSWKNFPLLSNPSVVSDSNVFAYLSRYGLDTIGTPPLFGTFKSDSFICVGQIYRPEGPSRGTVIFIHGLFDHVGTNINAIISCLKENYTFAAFDLPGHGLSSGGVRCAIGDFCQYSAALDSFMKIITTLTCQPYVFIGHSTGCAVALEYIYSTHHQPFEQMIFLAPLVRSSSYRWSMFGYKVFHGLKFTPRRWHRKSSHDKDAILRFRNDPLQSRTFPLSWADAYFRWFKRIQNLQMKELPLLIIQGTKDNVVDWKYNLRWFGQKVKGSKVIRIDGAMHNLLNESIEYRLKCIDTIRSILRNIH